MALLQHSASALLRLLGPLACAAALLSCSVLRTTSTVPPPSLEHRVETPGMLFEVRYLEPPDSESADAISRALLRAGQRLSRWGEFRAPVQIRVYPTHDALEDALGLRGYPWLRAWAWSDQIALQGPRSWDPYRDVPDREVEELLTHELTHVLMYQLIEAHDEADLPPRPEPPLWFREGMASVTADQGHRRLGPGELSRWIAKHPGIDLLRPAAETYRTEKEAVYGAAHRAFELLLQKVGERGVRDILVYTAEGRAFEAAFALATGKTLQDFEAESVRMGFDARVVTRQATSGGAGGP